MGNNFKGSLKNFVVAFCDGAFRIDYFENLYRDDLIASIGFSPK